MISYYEDIQPLLVSVDCIVFGFTKGKLKILIGKRKMSPGFGQWSLYGDFVERDETLDSAAKRTLSKLTGLNDLYMSQVGAFGEVDRDPGTRVVSVAYSSLINVSDYDERLRKKYGVEWVDIDKLPELYSDHRKMVEVAVEQLRRQMSYEPICFNLLPELFTLTQLQNVYEAIIGHEVDKRNFRKRIKLMPFIQPTDYIDKLTSKRGAILYRFDEVLYQSVDKFRL